MNFTKLLLISAIAAALPSGLAFAIEAADISDTTGLDKLAPDTSLFLLEEFQFPSDDKATVYRGSDGYVRVDYFYSGHRLSRTEIPIGATYCAVMANASVVGYSESSKRLQITALTAPNPVARDGERGVGIELRSVQSTKIVSIACYQPNYATEPLTVQSMKQVIRSHPDDSAIAFIGPPASDRVLADARPTLSAPEIKSAVAVSLPQPVMTHVPVKVTVRTYQQLDQTHRQYVNLLKKQAEIAGPPESLAVP